MKFLIWLRLALMTPFRATIAGLMVLVNLDGKQMRALFSIAMLAGMMANSAANWFYINLILKMVDAGQFSQPIYSMVSKQIGWNSILTFWFALILGLTVWGADYFRAKIGKNEFSGGKGQKPGEGEC